MKNIYRIGLILFCAICAFSVRVSAQTVTNVTATQVDKNIHVSYHLDQQAEISLYLSTDGGQTYTELHEVSGDVGTGVSAGDKTIVWDVLAEKEKLVGEDIVFKVKAEGAMSFTVNGVTFKMIYVKGGTFTMGCTSEQGSDCYSEEKPSRQVTLSDFYMGETEVTQALWQAVMGNNPSLYKGDDRPVENVNWKDCQKFIHKLNQLTGKTFRLPTEAEWEYAARGGNKSRGRKYSGRNTIGNVAWYTDNSESSTHPVKGKQANELGLYDMSGNVWEWCQDQYGSKYYRDSPSINPTGRENNSGRVLRGGSWYSLARHCRVSHRIDDYPGHRYDHYGFRLVLVRVKYDSTGTLSNTKIPGQ